MNDRTKSPQIAIQVPGDAASFFQVCNENGVPMVRINLKDGTDEFSSDYQPDEAARAFWSAVTQSIPQSPCVL